MEKHCQAHALPSRYFCLECPDTEHLCALCVKDKHSKCCDALIVTSKQLRQIAVLPSKTKITEAYDQHAAKFLEENFSKLTNEFKNLKVRVNDFLSFVEYIDEDFYAIDRIQGVKAQYNIVFDKKVKKWRMEPRVYMANSNVSKLSRDFKTSLQKAIGKLVGDIEKQDLEIFPQIFHSDKFKSHQDLTIRPDEHSPRTFVLSLKKEHADGALGILAVPLTNAFFTIKIDKVNLKTIATFEIGVAVFKSLPSFSSIDFTHKRSHFKELAVKNSEFVSEPPEDSDSIVKRNKWIREGTVINILFQQQSLSVYDEQFAHKWTKKCEAGSHCFFYVLMSSADMVVHISEQLE